MIKIVITCCLFFLFGGIVAAQTDWPLKRKVNNLKARNTAFKEITPFSYTVSKTNDRGTYHELQIADSFLTQLQNQRPEALQLSIPSGTGQIVRCEMVKTDLGNVRFTINKGEP